MSTTIALITGATSGIGEATADVFADLGFHLILCGRRADRLAELQARLSAKVPVATALFDVRDQAQVNQALRALPEAFKPVDILVNNAGNAHGLDFIQDGKSEDWDLMIDSNIKGLLYVSQAIIPQMVARQRGHIVNVSSIAGKEVYQKGNVYCATKAAVEALSAGMLLDLNAYSIKVSNIAPGAANTGFSAVRFKNDLDRAAQVYAGFDPLTARDIAETIGFVVTRPAHVNLSDLSIRPTAQASATVVNRR